MSDVLKDYLRKFVLVFFNNILVYNKTLDEHLGHLELAFLALEEHKLYAHRKKCSFAQQFQKPHKFFY